MTSVPVVVQDGTWISLQITIAAVNAPQHALKPLKPHKVTFGTQIGQQFTVHLTPGTLQGPPAPIDPPVIDQP